MKKQVSSFLCAFKGIFEAIRTESHLRFHLVAAFYVIFFGALGDFNLLGWAVLIITISIVIFAELINTAVEDLCDLYSTDYNIKIKRIKDIAAGAVLVTAVASVFVAVCLFVFTGNLLLIIYRFMAYPLLFIPLGVSVVTSLLFLLLSGRKNKNKKDKK